MDRRRHRIAFALGLGTILVLAVAPGSGAQSGKDVAKSLCDALTPGEVRQAMGVKMTSSPDQYACYWRTKDIGDPERGVTAIWGTMTWEGLQALGTDATPLTIGGHPAMYDPDQWTLDIGLDQGVLVLTGTALQNMDMQPALTQLGELLASRSADLIAPPQPDPELLALIPPTVGGEPFVVNTPFVEAEYPGINPSGKALRSALKAADKTLADVSLAGAVAYPDEQFAGIGATRVAGADAVAFAEAAVEYAVGPTWTAEPETFTNGEVSVVTGMNDLINYAYPMDDVMWLINAEEPALSEILAALPGAPTLPVVEEPIEEPEEGPGQEPADDATSEGSVGDLVPTSLGGEELTVQTMEGSSGGGFNDPKSRTYKALTAGLESQGKTVDDITIAAAGDANGTIGILGIEVDGADASVFVDFAIETILAGLPSRKHETEPVEMAGKAVTLLRPQQSMGRVFYIYPQGDIVWVVGAPDELLEEAFEALP